MSTRCRADGSSATPGGRSIGRRPVRVNGHLWRGSRSGWGYGRAQVRGKGAKREGRQGWRRFMLSGRSLLCGRMRSESRRDAQQVDWLG